MDSVKDRSRWRTSKAGTKLKKPANPGKPGDTATVPVDESTRALIDAIKGLKGLR